MRIRQDVLFEFTRPTTPKYVKSLSLVAPSKRSATVGMTAAVPRPRPELESFQLVQEQLAFAKKRVPRLALADESVAEKLLSEKDLPVALASQQWVRFLATMPKSGSDRIIAYQKAMERGTLDTRSKGIIAYVAARQDRAWYALGHAIERLKKLGMSEVEIQSFDSPSTAKTKSDAVLIRFATILSADPAMISDEDFRDMQRAEALPIWARMMVSELPRTTAAYLELDRAQRTLGAVSPDLRAACRFVTAKANRCEYSMATARADAKSAHVPADKWSSIEDDSWKTWSKDEQLALEFAKQMSLDSDSICDEFFSKLVSKHGDQAAACMVLHSAYANFQDRFLLCLQISRDNSIGLPPVTARFAPEGFVSTTTPRCKRKTDPRGVFEVIRTTWCR